MLTLLFIHPPPPFALQTADRYSRGRLTRLKTLLDAHRVEYQERDVFYMRDEDIETLWDRAGTQVRDRATSP